MNCLLSNRRISVQTAKSIKLTAFGQRLNTKQGGSCIDKRLNADLVKHTKREDGDQLVKLAIKS